MRTTVLILFTIFYVNTFAEDGAVQSGDPHLRRATDPRATAAVSMLSSTPVSSKLSASMKRYYEIGKKLKLENGESPNEISIPTALANHPVEVERNHSFGGAPIPDIYLKLLDDSSGSEPVSSEQVDRTTHEKDGAQ